MKIAIDSGPISKDSRFGMGTYVRELTDHLAGVDIKDFSKDDLTGYKLLHFTKFRPYFISLPFFKSKDTKWILTIYDLIPLIYPDHYPPGVRGWLKWQINKFLIRKNIDAIITISETSKKDICRFIGLDPIKVFVTYLAAPEEYQPVTNHKSLVTIMSKYNLPDKFALCDADVYYSKNIPNLVRACELAKLPLVLVGAGKKTIEYGKTINFNDPELVHLKNINWDKVTLLSGIELTELVKIYNLADVFVQASYYEGFGIPLIQAINCGLPVVITKAQCLVETCGDDFSYVDPESPEDIAKGIKNPNIHKNLPRQYSWNITAKKTNDIYGKVLERI